MALEIKGSLLHKQTLMQTLACIIVLINGRIYNPDCLKRHVYYQVLIL